MNHYSATGVVKTPVLSLTKGCAHLIISTDKTLAEIENETVSVYVETKGGTDDIIREGLLKDFIILGTIGDDAVFPYGTFKTVAVVELTEDGGNIKLGENETLKISLTSLNSAKTYQINSVESSYFATELRKVIRKTMAKDSLEQDFDMTGYDVVSMTKDDSISEISLTHSNGTVTKYDLFEADVITISDDPYRTLSDTGTIGSAYANRLVLPLKDIVKMNIRKSDAIKLDMHLRIDASDYDQYQKFNK